MLSICEMFGLSTNGKSYEACGVKLIDEGGKIY